MAITVTNNGAKVSISSEQLPTGYVYPTPTTFTDHEYVRDYTITMTKASVQNATATTTVANIVTAVNTAVSALISADVDLVNLTSVTIWTDIRSIRLNDKLAETKYTSGTVNYLVNVKIYWKTA